MQNLIDQKQIDQFWTNLGIVNQEFDQETMNRTGFVGESIF
ncbi:hypothetical protein [Acinetobacter baumannii]|nr:hypothetical protein [Acinetobacter baumannii]